MAKKEKSYEKKLKRIERKVRVICPRLGAIVTDGKGTYRLNKDKKTYCLIRWDLTEGETELTIPPACDGKPVTSIGSLAFCRGDHNDLKEVVVPDGVKIIEDGAFALCLNLKRVLIPNSVTTIEQYAFLYCRSLTEIFLPESVVKIEDKLFEGCDALKKIFCEVAQKPDGWERGWVYSHRTQMIYNASRSDLSDIDEPSEPETEIAKVGYRETVEQLLSKEEEDIHTARYFSSQKLRLLYLFRRRGLWCPGDEIGLEWYLLAVEYAEKAWDCFDGNYQKLYMCDAISSFDALSELSLWEKAIRCSLKAAEHGNDIAMMNYAIDLFHRNQHEEAYKWFGRASEHGHANADCALALYYKHGYAPVEADENGAKKHLDRYENRSKNNVRNRILALGAGADFEKNRMISHWQMTGWLMGHDGGFMIDTFRTSGGLPMIIWWRK